MSRCVKLDLWNVVRIRFIFHDAFRWPFRAAYVPCFRPTGTRLNARHQSRCRKCVVLAEDGVAVRALPCRSRTVSVMDRRGVLYRVIRKLDYFGGLSAQALSSPQR